MRNIPVVLSMALTLLVCSGWSLAGSEQESETRRLNTWLDEQYESELQRSPLFLTILGRKEQYDLVDDFSLATRIERLDWLESSAADMARRFEYTALTPQGKNSYDFWAFRAEIDGAGRPYLRHAYVFDQSSGWHRFPVEFLLAYHVVDTEDDMAAYIERVRGFSRALDQLLAKAQAAADLGIRPPRFAYETVLEEVRAIITGHPFDDSDGESPIWRDGASKIAALSSNAGIDAVAAAALRARLERALLNEMLPAYRRLIAWQEQDMVNAPDPARGVSSLPDGLDYYQERLRYFTHSEMTADEVHKLGLREVGRIQAEMKQIVQDLGFDGSLQEFFRFVREDSRFYFPQSDEGREAYLTQTRELLKTMDARLPDYFGLLPKSELIVKRVEAYREQDGAAQSYQVGTADGTRPGVYYVHLSDMSTYNKVDLETTAYHEGSPGHHMQLSIAKELTGIPRFRTDIGYSAYAEGWGLYAEKLAKEMGAFEDPYNDFGRLVAEILRAIRLVVDSGLHAKGWSEMQAVNYMLENSAIPEGAVRSEIRRYLVMPGQATSYKAGMLKIQELRADAQARLGEDFDIRGFHDTVLGGGAVPLPILERAVDDWIESQSAAAR